MEYIKPFKVGIGVRDGLGILVKWENREILLSNLKKKLAGASLYKISDDDKLVLYFADEDLAVFEVNTNNYYYADLKNGDTYPVSANSISDFLASDKTKFKWIQAGKPAVVLYLLFKGQVFHIVLYRSQIESALKELEHYVKSFKTINKILEYIGPLFEFYFTQLPQGGFSISLHFTASMNYRLKIKISEQVCLFEKVSINYYPDRGVYVRLEDIVDDFDCILNDFVLRELTPDEFRKILVR